MWHGGGNRRGESRKCYNCDEVGHLSRDCRNPRRERQGGYAGAAARGVEQREDPDGRMERQREALVKQIGFKRRMEMNRARMERGKKEANYLLLTHKTALNLRHAGKEAVVGILEEINLDYRRVTAMNIHPERDSVLEVLLDPRGQVDIEEINRKIVEKGLEFDVEHIGNATETVNVRKLPLTTEPNLVAELIKHAIAPYVEKVVDIVPNRYKLKEEEREKNYYKFMENNLDGSYRVRFVPLDKEVIPGFIPVGPEGVKGEVKYQKGEDKNLLCSNCFLGGHLRGDGQCSATMEEGWAAYVEKFRIESERRALERGVQMEAPASELDQLKKKYEDLKAAHGKEIDIVKKLRKNLERRDEDMVDLLAAIRGGNGESEQSMEWDLGLDDVLDFVDAREVAEDDDEEN